MAKDKGSKEKFRKAMKGVGIVYTVLALLFGLFMVGVLTFVGVGLWRAIAPIFGL